MKLTELVQKHPWDDIQKILPEFYPQPRKTLAEYEEAYLLLRKLAPVEKDMRILFERDVDEASGRVFVDVYGKNGTLWKDELSGQGPLHQGLQEIGEQEVPYGLCFTAWAEYLGMEIDPALSKSCPEAEIILHCLMDLTRFWHSRAAYARVLKELNALEGGEAPEPLIRREKQHRVNFQVWSELPDGTFHGLYTTYWGSSQVRCVEGFYVQGEKEGVWSYWNQAGQLIQQARFVCERQVEIKNSAPWWGAAADQEI